MVLFHGIRTWSTGTAVIGTIDCAMEAVGNHRLFYTIYHGLIDSIRTIDTGTMITVTTVKVLMVH